MGRGVPLLLIMVIWVGLKLPIDEPFAVALVNVTGLKWARGRMPPLAVQHGASAITSAEEVLDAGGIVRDGAERRLLFAPPPDVDREAHPALDRYLKRGERRHGAAI